MRTYGGTIVVPASQAQALVELLPSAQEVEGAATNAYGYREFRVKGVNGNDLEGLNSHWGPWIWTLEEEV